MTKKFFHKTSSLKRKILGDEITELTSNNMINREDDIVSTDRHTDTNTNTNTRTDTNANSDTDNKHDEDTSLYNNNNDFLILSNLTVLSKIQKYDKLIIIIHEDKKSEKINFEIKIDNTYLKSISRWYYGQTRQLTIDYINKLVDIAISSHNQCNNNITMNKYITLLESAKIGLSNLKFTYYYDQTIISNLDIIIEKIDMFKINTITKSM
jgi:hypothetical protein